MSFGNLFATYSLQKLFSLYYLASGGPVNEFRLSQFRTHCSSDYDILLCPVLSHETLTIISDGLIDRLEKVRILSAWEPAQKTLDVCHVHNPKNIKNGTSDCAKCMRTVLELLAVGGLERFSSVFDVDYVNSHREEFLAELLRGKLQKNCFTIEIWPYRKNMGFTWKDYILATWIVVKKIVKKVLRRGRTSYTFSPRG